jgi:hypothetical protein
MDPWPPPRYATAGNNRRCQPALQDGCRLIGSNGVYQ